MKLSELVSQMTPTTYTELALVLFVLTFAGIVWFVTSKRNNEFFDRAARAPLDDGTVAAEANEVTQ